MEDKNDFELLINADCCSPWEPERKHKWLYFNYERYCRLCERLEFFWDKIWKACNPPKQVKTLMASKKLSDVLSLREIRELPVVLDSEGNMKLIKEAK